MLVAVAVVSWALLALVVIALLVSRGPGPSLVKKTVVVHTKDEKTIRGILHGKYADRWVLRDAVLVHAGGTEQALGGLQHVLVGNVSFAQELEEVAD